MKPNALLNRTRVAHKLPESEPVAVIDTDNTDWPNTDELEAWELNCACGKSSPDSICASHWAQQFRLKYND